ncbi:hypothetical protein WBG78_01385 [Chryseolinea sp. T2]|uniref:hypothetical protein n=1 Tax=Chryseolinea sp. T2 TaxID=3129255 RepID=UPI0030784FB3
MANREEIKTNGDAGTVGANMTKNGSGSEDGKVDEQQKQSSGSEKENDAKTTTDQSSDDDSKPFDFGGLPNRNLKKNLGCG